MTVPEEAGILQSSSRAVKQRKLNRVLRGAGLTAVTYYASAKATNSNLRLRIRKVYGEVFDP